MMGRPVMVMYGRTPWRVGDPGAVMEERWRAEARRATYSRIAAHPHELGLLLGPARLVRILSPNSTPWRGSKAAQSVGARRSVVRRHALTGAGARGCTLRRRSPDAAAAGKASEVEVVQRHPPIRSSPSAPWLFGWQVVCLAGAGGAVLGAGRCRARGVRGGRGLPRRSCSPVRHSNAAGQQSHRATLDAGTQPTPIKSDAAARPATSALLHHAPWSIREGGIDTADGSRARRSPRSS